MMGCQFVPLTTANLSKIIAAARGSNSTKPVSSSVIFSYPRNRASDGELDNV
ncbi:hypothetical protein GGE24_003658 [Bradyrhizobium centrosematis]|nr:hypothetical protein [Bradyrhizobium centrosematis]MCS3774319.1 hypothetical protein [Bradyrhizobium centrosematis]